MENYILLLIAAPIIFSLLYLLGSKKSYYKLLSGLLCCIGTILAAMIALNGPQKVQVSGELFHTIESIILVSEVVLTLFLYWVSIRNKRWGVLTLTVLMTGLSIYSYLFMEKSESVFFYVDKLSIVLALVVNIVGTLIIMFSNEYIGEYEKHRGLKNRQKLYYFVICIFISAMNGLIFSDSLSWVYFFWEVTTVTSFVLISYNNDEEALNSGFRALFLNIIGGICFAVGIILFKNIANIDSLSQVIEGGKAQSLYAIPVFLLCIAGFAKSAQFPFQSWLLGAMVAPTPVSALLHSSTMVKAGVYLIVKLSPAYAGTTLGTAIAIFGGFSFLICSAIAVTQRNAKRVLAYSTIANLGLIISSAGMGSSIAVSAAMMLIIFHAISKALLFLCAGQIEHTIGSRDIEDMTGLIRKAPILTILCAFGILSMILPPFGVLITKWVSIEAAAKNPLVTIFLIIGSAFTTAYYLKWLGTLLAYPINDLKPKYPMKLTTYLPLGLLGIAILGTSILLTPIFNLFVSPEVTGLLKSGNELSGSYGKVYSSIGSFNNGVVFLVAAAGIVVFLLVKKMVLSSNIKNVYLCGENSSESNFDLGFRNGNGAQEKAVVSSIYMSDFLDEKKITTLGYIISIAMILIILTGGIL